MQSGGGPRSPSPERQPALPARRRKAYLVAAYTGELDVADARARAFCYDAEDPSHAKLAEQLGPDELQRLRPAGEGEGFRSASGAATDATVRVEITGVLGGARVTSGVHTLSRADHDSGVFQPGSIDEFAISCEDLGDIASLRVWHENDGADLQSSRWKLEKIVITCIQSTDAEVGGLKGDYAQRTMKTNNSDQWHFVWGRWLGWNPADTDQVDAELQAVEARIAELQRELDGAQAQADRLGREKTSAETAAVSDRSACETTIQLDARAEQGREWRVPELPSIVTRDSSLRWPLVAIGTALVLVVLLYMLWPTSAPGVPDAPDAVPADAPPPSPPPPLPVCDAAAVDEARCDCEQWAAQEAAPTQLAGLCAESWDALDGSWEAADTHMRCKSCCEGVVLPGGAPDLAAPHGGLLSSLFGWLGLVFLCLLILIIASCDAHAGGHRRRRLGSELRAGWQGARRRIPPRRGTFGVTSDSSRSRSPSPGRRGRRSRSRSPGRSTPGAWNSVSRDSMY